MVGFSSLTFGFPYCYHFFEIFPDFLILIRRVSQLPGYGDYSLHTRTENKRTTLSALYMFLALSSEAGNNPRRAVMFCNKAIGQDPGWMIPFNKRAEYFRLIGIHYSNYDLGYYTTEVLFCSPTFTQLSQ